MFFQAYNIDHHEYLKGGGGASSSKGSAKASKAKVKSDVGSGGEGGVAEETDYSKAKRALATIEPATKKKQKQQRQAKVDSHVPNAGFYVVEGDWDCMLNQTNIGHNNNKYYVIQMLKRTPIL
jgi:poly [ADP-ribose] polymerase